MTAKVGMFRGNRTVTDLVTCAGSGDTQAWDSLVERYAPLIWSICRRYRLYGADAADAGQSVWLHLVGQLGNIRDPAALAGWLATTTQRECLRILRAQSPPTASAVIGTGKIAHHRTEIAEQELLRAERHAALRGSVHPPAATWPAVAHPAPPRPSPALYQDQRHPGHPGQ